MFSPQKETSPGTWNQLQCSLLESFMTKVREYTSQSTAQAGEEWMKFCRNKPWETYAGQGLLSSPPPASTLQSVALNAKGTPN